MTFDEVMQARSGKWADGRATIIGPTGYYVIIATGSPESYTITHDGKRFVTDVVVEKPAASVVEDTVALKPFAKRGRKAVLSVDE